MSHQNPDQTGWLKRFAFDRPVLFSALVIVAAVLFTEIPLNVLLTPWIGDPGGRFLEGIVEGSLVIDTSRPGLILLYTGLVLSIGFFEEILGRGVVLTVMLRKWGSTRRGIYQAVLVSSALFGAAHIVNMIAGRLPLLSTLTQIVYGFFFAVIFAACVLRNNSIWPMVIMHAAFDFGGRGLQEIAVGGASQMPAANSTPEGAITTFMLTLPLFLYGIFILRKVAPSERPDNVLGFPASPAEIGRLSTEY